MFDKSVAFMTIACFRSVLKPVYPHLNKCCSIYHVRVFQICYQSLHFQKLQVILNLDLDFGLCFSKVYAPLTGCYLHILVYSSLRDRPFNLKGGVMVFCSVQKFFFGQHKSQNIYFFCRTKCKICFQNLTLGYMTKTNSESDYYFFPPSKSEYFFQQHWESEYFFRKKP